MTMSVATVPKRAGYLVAGGAGLLIAAGYLAMSMELPFGRLDQPGIAVFPVIVGCVLVVASLIAIWEGLKLDPGVRIEIPTGADLKRLLCLVALLVAFLIALPLLGLLISSTIFCTLLMRCLSNLGWPRVIAYSCVMCGGLYAVFIILLKVPLPRGLLSP